MSNYRVSQESLTSIANAIRNRFGISQELVYPQDFINALQKPNRTIPIFTYSGGESAYEIVHDDDTKILDVESYTGNWKIRFLQTGTLIFQDLLGALDGIDIFLVGGGGGASNDYGAGGGGGYTLTQLNYTNLTAFNEYPISIGEGGKGIAGNGTGGSGGNSTAFGFTVNGGQGSTSSSTGGKGGGNGGSGGAGCNNGTGGADGGNGTNGQYSKGGTGQGTTTREFAESTGKLYAGGGGSEQKAGGAGGGGAPGYNGTTNTGGGAGSQGKNGGSGIVIIRNKRG